MASKRVPNSRFGAGDQDDPPVEDAPLLEYYQTSDGDLRVEEAAGPTGAWIEMEVA